MPEFNIQETLTRKLGPLRTWQWGLLGAGGILIYRRLRPAVTPQRGTGSVSGDAEGGALYGTLSGSGLPATPLPALDPGYGAAVEPNYLRVGDREFSGSDAALDKIINLFKPPVPGPPPPASIPAPAPKPPAPAPVAPALNPLAVYETIVRNTYLLEGVRPPSTATVTRIALELKQGRTVTNLRQSIRANETRAGRTTVAQSKAYWKV